MADDTLVIRSGLIFKAGDYRPKRDFALTPTELLDAARAFHGPQDVELEHFTSQGRPTILDGHLGRLVSVWASADGRQLFGQVQVPQWLDTMWGDAGRKVSAVWETVNGAKRLMRLGLCLNPVIPDAVLFAETDVSTFAARVGGSMRRHFDQSEAAAQVARMQTQRRQAVEKGQTMNREPIRIPWGMPTFEDVQRERVNDLVGVAAAGRAILAGNKPLIGPKQPAQFAESPADVQPAGVASDDARGAGSIGSGGAAAASAGPLREYRSLGHDHAQPGEHDGDGPPRQDAGRP